MRVPRYVLSNRLDRYCQKEERWFLPVVMSGL